MSDQLDTMKAEIERAKSALGSTAGARTARGKNVKAATKSRRDSTWRSAVFSVRCKPEIADALRQLAKSRGAVSPSCSRRWPRQRLTGEENDTGTGLRGLRRPGGNRRLVPCGRRAQHQRQRGGQRRTARVDRCRSLRGAAGGADRVAQRITRRVFGAVAADRACHGGEPFTNAAPARRPRRARSPMPSAQIVPG